jgi:hypothetical protein
MNIRTHIHRFTIVAGVFVVVAGAVFVNTQQARATGDPTSRQIQMSNSTAGATGVSYKVSFTTVTPGPIEGIVVDFCDNDPIIGDSCTYTSGQSPNIGSATIGAVTGPSNTAFTIASQASPLLVLTNAGASSSVNAGTPVSFTISNVTNPNYLACGGGTVPNCTFYARVLTYATTGGATGYLPANPSNGAVPSDAGGIALSTASNVIVTAKVQEQINFCVYTGVNCAAGGTAINLGDNDGVLSPAGPFVDVNTKYDISTNATAGAIVSLKGDTLKSGSNAITAIGSTPTASNPGTAQFGLCTYESAGANLTATSPYNNAGCSGTTQTAGTALTGGTNSALFALDTNNTTGTTSTYGEQLASAVAGTQSTGTVVFIGNIPVSQVAGIYNTSFIFIATGTY